MAAVFDSADNGIFPLLVQIQLGVRLAPVVPALGKLGQEDHHELEASLGCMV